MRAGFSAASGSQWVNILRNPLVTWGGRGTGLLESKIDFNLELP